MTAYDRLTPVNMSKLADEWHAADRKRDRKDLMWLCVWLSLTFLVIGAMLGWFLAVRVMF
jgi:hypothetical protein